MRTFVSVLTETNAEVSQGQDQLLNKGRINDRDKVVVFWGQNIQRYEGNPTSCADD